MSFARLRTHFAQWREWELNPIVVKELRQAVRSWAITGMLLLFLVVLFITAVAFLVTQSFNVNDNQQLGGMLFPAFLVILAAASVLFIPLYLGIRVAGERQESNRDLLYASTLSPARIIRGKFLCGAYMALLFFSACMPFMAFTNLLRGVDLPTVFFILCFLFLVVCVANMVAIFLACVPASRPFKVLFALAGFIASGWIIIPLALFSLEMMRFGMGTTAGGHDFWIRAASFLGLGIALIGLFFVLSVALISPPSANRAWPVRLYITVVWLLSGVLDFIWVVQTGDDWRLIPWIYPTFILMMCSLLVTISNQDQLGLRVRRTIPASRSGRFFAFFFFNGAAGGLLWVAGILAATYLAARIAIAWTVTPGIHPVYVPGAESDYHWYAVTAAYAFAYALTALFIQRTFFSKYPAKLAGLIAVMLAGGWALIPSIVLFCLNRLTWKSVDGLQLGNMFNVFSLRDGYQQIYHVCFAFGWLLVMLIINARWFFQQVKNFHPPAPLPVPPPIPPALPGAPKNVPPVLP
jgi:hypothetical protein